MVICLRWYLHFFKHDSLRKVLKFNHLKFGDNGVTVLDLQIWKTADSKIIFPNTWKASKWLVYTRVNVFIDSE